MNKRKNNTSPLKIAVLGHKTIPSRQGGIEIVVEELTVRMAKLGHKITVYNRNGHNLYDKNAVQVYDQREKLIGYVPRYYAEAFAAFIKEKRVKKGKILCVDKNRNCDECIKIEVSVAGV